LVLVEHGIMQSPPAMDVKPMGHLSCRGDSIAFTWAKLRVISDAFVVTSSEINWERSGIHTGV
jgi:hypothetical protein